MMDYNALIAQGISDFVHNIIWGIGFAVLVVIIVLVAKALAENPNLFGNEGGAAL